MSKKLIIIAGVVVVLAGAGVAGWVALKGNDKTISDNSTQTDQPAQTQPQSEVMPKTINGFLAAGKNQKCTFSSSAGEAQTSGTMYFAGERMRGEYKSVSDGQTTNGQMIITDGLQYFWEPSSKRGVKLTISQQDAEESAGNTSSGSQGGLETDAEYDFNCDDWTVDQSRFTPPSDIEFMDISGIQSQIPG